jgi:hypothetical protein
MTTKAELAALEKIFAAEIVDRLPFQSKAKIYARLVEQGLVEPMVREFGSVLGKIRCEGWALSQLGRMTYCMSCDDDEPNDSSTMTPQTATNAQG